MFNFFKGPGEPNPTIEIKGVELDNQGEKADIFFKDNPRANELYDKRNRGEQLTPEEDQYLQKATENELKNIKEESRGSREFISKWLRK